MKMFEKHHTLLLLILIFLPLLILIHTSPPASAVKLSRSRGDGPPVFAICDDPANCVITCCCPCITFGQIAEIVNDGSSSCASSGAVYGVLLAFTGLSCLYSCFYRSRLRGKYDLEEAPCVDCLVHFCCETCALRQEYRELKNRGFDMGIGWDANIDRQKRGVTMAPIVVSPMTR